jgi:two-component sensor histidine kinase
MLSKGQASEAFALIADVHRRHPPRNDEEQLRYLLVMGAIYANTKQYQKAEENLLLAQKLEKPIEAVSGPINTGSTLHDLGDLYYEEGRYQEAEHCLRGYLVSPFCQHLSRSTSYSAALRTLLKIDSVLGNTAAAIRDYRKYSAVMDEHYNTMQAMQGDDLMIQYETEKREKDIQLLTAKARLQQNQLQQTAFTRTIAYCGVAVALLLAGLIYNRYRIKQKSNRGLQLQKEEIDRKNIQLQALVEEKDGLIDAKEWLLKEVHHRVKNNLQVMLSLLNLQSTSLTGEALTAVRESRNRLYAMSIIHQLLYNTDNSSMIDMNYYVGTLAQHLKDIFSSGNTIEISLNLEPIQLEVTQAIAVGLILNEAITNSFKYAFSSSTAGKPGRLEIDMRIDEEVAGAEGETTAILIRVRDNGPGFPLNTKVDENTSLGLSLMHMLADELSATLSITNSSGAEIRLRFTPLQPLAQNNILV